MLCKRCQQLSPELRRAVGLRSGGDAIGSRLDRVVCARCGTILPITDSTETMLETITQLARFGLTPGGKPLFERVRSDR